MNSADKLSLYFGEDYRINDYIVIHSPTIGDVVKMGEREYYSVVHIFTAIPSDMKVQLWDMGFCWEDITDFQLFVMLCGSLKVEKSRMLFGDLDFSKFEVGQNMDNGEIVLYQDAPDGGKIVIDRYIHSKIANTICTMHNITPKVEKAGSKTVRKILIDEARAELNKKKENQDESMLLPLVSSLINSPEFSYGLNEIKSMPLYAFFDSVRRVQVIRNSTALLNGCYCGMIDTSKINKKDLNWMQNLS